MVSVANSCFHTANRILVPEEYEGLLPQMDEMCRHFSDLWSHTRPGSDVWRINHAQGDAVTVALETAELLLRCQRLCRETGGAFNILTHTFKASVQREPWTERETLGKLAAELAGRDFRVEGDQVWCPPGAALDLGGIAKGAMCDRLAAFLRARGVGCGLLDLGGNIYALGSREDGAPWMIGVRDPEKGPGEWICRLAVRDCSVVTSGMYEQDFTYRGRRCHHIFDPATGLPVENEITSVTVVGEDSARCDAWATALTVMGARKAEAYMRRAGVRALILTKDGRSICSGGLL